LALALTLARPDLAEREARHAVGDRPVGVGGALIALAEERQDVGRVVALGGGGVVVERDALGRGLADHAALGHGPGAGVGRRARGPEGAQRPAARLVERLEAEAHAAAADLVAALAAALE